MKSHLLAQRSADQRGEQRSDIDAHIEDGVGAVATRITGRIKPAHLRGDVGLECAIAQDQRDERDQEQRLKRHHEMPDGHQRRAEQDGAVLSEQTVGEKAAEQRCEIDEAGIEPIDLGGERLRAERSADPFESALEHRKAEHVMDVVRQQQVLRHVEDEQCAHSVIREALPHLGREQEREPARMTKEIMCGEGVGAVLERGSHGRNLLSWWLFGYSLRAP